jgi:DNA polymerase III delta prime subunit
MMDIPNEALDREDISNRIKEILNTFEANINNIHFKKGIYIYGSPGSGKTHFVKRLLRETNHDIIHYDAGDVRNKTLIESISSNNISTQNVLKMMKGEKQRIAIIMDEIDGMNNGDKGSITALIKLIRQKKTKKQRQEQHTLNPIICIGNYFVDKKIRELMKVCNVFELKPPTPVQISSILRANMAIFAPSLESYLIDYIQGDLRKLGFAYKVYLKNPDIFGEGEDFKYMFQNKTNNEDSKKITRRLLQEYVPLAEHRESMNETDRTIVALLWHENIIDCFPVTQATSETNACYLEILRNICFADYIDRITFQNQIWQFNEMSSLIKTFYANKIFHDFAANTKKSPPSSSSSSPPKDIRFTKVLTKYSTEYNNILFIYNLCNCLEMDKKDLLSMFQELRIQYLAGFDNVNCGDKQPSTLDKTRLNDLCNKIEAIFHHSSIDHLDVKRVFRYLDKNVKRETVVEAPVMEDDDDDEVNDFDAT